MHTFGETSFCLYPIPTIALLSRAAGSRTAPRCCACIALDPTSPVLQVGFPLWPCLWGCPQHPAVGQWDGPAVRSCPAAPGGKAPGPHITLTQLHVPRKLLSVVGLATGDSQLLLTAKIPHGHDVNGAIFCTITAVYSG